MSRLEEIKKQFFFWIEEDESIGILPEDIEWLIQQAERVEELEKEKEELIARIINAEKENELLYSSIKTTEEQNKSYKQALEEIANA